ncbi:MAG: M28 family peptidase [Cyclonatronaceae bacterium]
MTALFRTFILSACIFFVYAPGLPASATDPYTQAWLKWDAGDYTGALEDFLGILNSPDAELHFDDIARLTGEIYKVDTLSEDGRNPVFSPDNRHLAWTESREGITSTVIARVVGPATERLYEMEGDELVFSPDGRYAVLGKTEITTRMRALQKKLNEALQARDRPAISRLRSDLQYEMAVNRSMFRVDIRSGQATGINTGGMMIRTPAFDAGGVLWFSGADPGAHTHSDIYSMDITADRAEPVKVTGSNGFYDAPQPAGSTDFLVYSSFPVSPFPFPAGSGRDTLDVPSEVVLYHTGDGEVQRWEGRSPVLSLSGNRVAFIHQRGRETQLRSAEIGMNAGSAVLMAASTAPVQHPALSPDGSKLAYMLREGISWDLRLVHTTDGTGERLSFDIQHELFPHFLTDDNVLGMMGEARHRRSHNYDVNTKEVYRLFHNNSIRTVSMENAWAPSADGRFMLVVAQRDGNTISSRQGVYMVRISDRIEHETLVNRLQENLDAERGLLAKANNLYDPIYDAVKEATREINITRLYTYQKSLYDFGSKHMTMPGNRKASEYIYQTLKSFGYEPELQWFSPSEGVETANVIARLEGTTHPEVVYILSSHFDSVLRSPGADDNSTGTAVLLEAARVLAQNPQPATIIFASLTAEESGLLGAREFVRVAGEEGLRVYGVINNDMMGWTRHHRLDNTIRFSNYGIRDVQHSGAILFTDLITYDSRYYRNTDAHVFFDAYGDVIGGIGSYPILGNPNYHQPTDRLETINHRLVQEVSRSTTATLMLLSNAPSKVTGIQINNSGNRTEITWNKSPENDIDHYLVRYTNSSGIEQTERAIPAGISLLDVDISRPVSVAAVNTRGMTSWDWAVAGG